jgi:hypothetical protein
MRQVLEVDYVAIQARRPYPIFGGITYNVQHANSIYQAALLPAPFTYGNTGADILREDKLKNLDFPLFKQFQVNERVRVQFRAEAFNLTNSPRFSALGANIDTALRGRVTSSLSTPRNVQLALKFSF